MRLPTHRIEFRLRNGFTIVELLMVMGIIVILIGLIIVALRGVQNQAARTQSVNSLRQMVGGYSGYATDNRGRLMPGFVDHDDTNSPKLNAKIAPGDWIVPPGAPVGDREMLSSYVWRLAPYLEHNWQTVMTDYRDPGLLAHFESEYNLAFDYVPNPDPAQPAGGVLSTPDQLTGIAMMPSYGLNSIFLGGDNRHGGSSIASMSPWSSDEPIAATRMSEVRNPASVIVFAPSGFMNSSWTSADDSVYVTPDGFNQPRGYAELRPPFLLKDNGVWQEEQWDFAQPPGVTNPNAPPLLIARPSGLSTGVAGLPIMRHGSEHLAVGLLDGSATVVPIGELTRDMRRWSPFETGTEPPAFQP